MYQQINMYQPVFSRQPMIFSTATLLKIIVLVIVLMFALYTNAHSKIQGLQRISADLALNYTQLDARLGMARATTALSGSSSKNDEISTIQTRIRDQYALIEHIDSLFTTSKVGFGDVFESLAQTSLPGLWLTGIQLSHNGSIEISGTTLDPTLVPHYLQLIARQSSLNSLNSGTVDLIRAGSNSREINFVLSYNTHGEEH